MPRQFDSSLQVLVLCDSPRVHFFSCNSQGGRTLRITWVWASLQRTLAPRILQGCGGPPREVPGYALITFSYSKDILILNVQILWLLLDHKWLEASRGNWVRNWGWESFSPSSASKGSCRHHHEWCNSTLSTSVFQSLKWKWSHPYLLLQVGMRHIWNRSVGQDRVGGVF